MANNPTNDLEIFFNLSEEDVRKNTFGQTVQHGTNEIFEWYVPKTTQLADALNKIIENVKEEKIRVKVFISKLFNETKEKQVKDLLKGLHDTTEKYATKDKKAYHDVLEDELWVLENLRDALEELTIDGTEGEKNMKINKKAIWGAVLVKGGESGNEADKSE